jgi:peptide/nickel transport system permease protein
MSAYLIRRGVEALLTVILASFLVFAMIAALPGDPALAMLGDRATPDQLQALRAYLGLDQPLVVQYIRWIRRIAHGDLGYSLINGYPVSSILARAFPITLQLSGWALAIVLLVSFPTGVYAATHPRSRLTALLNWYHGFALAVPIFWLGVLLSWFFGVWMRWLPPSGFVPFTESPARWARAMILPGVSLGLGVGSIMARFIQASLEDVLGRDYIRTARAKGVAEHAVIWLHSLRNALIPILTVFAIYAGFFLGGAVITESVFAIPGMGSALWRAILSRDHLVTQSIILVSVIGFVLISLLTDLAYGLVDPRIRYTQRGLGQL